MEQPLNQSAWRRGWNDTKSIWTSWPFFVLDVVVAGIIGGVFGWYWGLAIVVFGMFCVWIGATVRAPYKQRNQARQKVNDNEKEFATQLTNLRQELEQLQLNRPRLEVDVADVNEEPAMSSELTKPGMESYWLRVRVMNSGGAIADRCHGRITKFMDVAGNTLAHDPVMLHWIETNWEYPYSEVSLAKKEHRFLDVLVQMANPPSQPLLFMYGTGQIDGLFNPLPTGTKRIEIVVYCNADPCSKEFQIECDAHPTYKAIRLKPSIPGKESSQT